MMMAIMMVMLIMITIKIMNVKDIWLTSLNAIPQVKISFAVAYDFNQLIYALRAPPWPRPHPADLDPIPTLPCPAQ